MPVEVFGDARTPREPQIHPDVHSVGPVGRLERDHHAAQREEELLVLLVAQVAQARDVATRQHQQVPRAVGVRVERHERRLVAPQHAR